MNGQTRTLDMFDRDEGNRPLMNRVIRGNALEVLPALVNRGLSFDVVIADPPYNIGKDFGNNSSEMPIEDYISWTRDWIHACIELLTDNGLLYVYGFPEIIARISVEFPLNQQRWLVWHYTNKTVPSSRTWQRSHESILCLWKPELPRVELEIDQIREPYTESFLRNAGRRRNGTPSRFGSSGKATIYNAHEHGALPRDVIRIPALAGGAGRSERWFMCRTCGGKVFAPGDLSEHRGHDVLKHPTQKPMRLTRRLIRSRVNGNGGSVLVPFAGSGSECVAAKELGLAFLGIELNPEYVDFANQWLSMTAATNEGL